MQDHEVQLGDEHLLLRAFKPGDAEAIYEAVCESKAELARWLPWCHADYSIADTQEFLNQRSEAFAKQGEHAFAIIERHGNRFVGATGINQIDRGTCRANLGYWLRTSATGRGYATRCTRLVAQWAFKELGLQRIEIVAAVGNVASQRVATRAGATREGIARNRLRHGQKQLDAVVFSLVPADFDSPERKLP
jgi:ribosomal-protein-serine acetyltransferase